MAQYESAIVKGDRNYPSKELERAILVGVERPGLRWPVEESLAELMRLADTAGVKTVATTTQKLSSPNPKTFIGSGKVEELAQLCITSGANVIIFDDELSPSQQTNLEKSVQRDVKIIDRTALILDIFALHATSKEGRLQVRLAQNQYLLPRLRGMWAHLASNRMGGGVGSRFGEGESQLEVDRRLVRKRITSIKKELEHLSSIRNIQRETRYTSGIYKVALAGYTNAGKSSLLNALTDSDVLAYDKLFATLDSTTRKLTLPEGREVTLTDTVGFIQKLPTTLVEAFKSTLDEINGANLIMHVVDAHDDNFLEQITAVHEILEQIHASKIDQVLVFNKCDLLNDEILEGLQHRFSDALFVSARTGEGLHSLIAKVGECAAAQEITLDILVPYNKGGLVSLAHQRCQINTEEHTANGTHMILRANPKIAAYFSQYKTTPENQG